MLQVLEITKKLRQKKNLQCLKNGAEKQIGDMVMNNHPIPVYVHSNDPVSGNRFIHELQKYLANSQYISDYNLIGMMATEYACVPFYRKNFDIELVEDFRIAFDQVVRLSIQDETVQYVLVPMIYSPFMHKYLHAASEGAKFVFAWQDKKVSEKHAFNNRAASRDNSRVKSIMKRNNFPIPYFNVWDKDDASDVHPNMGPKKTVGRQQDAQERAFGEMREDIPESQFISIDLELYNIEDVVNFIVQEIEVQQN